MGRFLILVVIITSTAAWAGKTKKREVASSQEEMISQCMTVNSVYVASGKFRINDDLEFFVKTQTGMLIASQLFQTALEANSKVELCAKATAKEFQEKSINMNWPDILLKSKKPN